MLYVPLLSIRATPGYVDDVHGYDFQGACSTVQLANGSTGLDCSTCTGDPWPGDESSSSHGTHVAGIIAAVQNNRQGISGGAPRVKVMVLKVRLTPGHGWLLSLTG